MMVELMTISQLMAVTVIMTSVILTLSSTAVHSTHVPLKVTGSRGAPLQQTMIRTSDGGSVERVRTASCGVHEDDIYGIVFSGPMIHTR